MALSESSSQDLFLVLCNAPDAETAAALAENLVTGGLAACVNILSPCRSIYRWQGRLEQETEIPLLIKTTAARLPEVKKAICARHGYETPEIIACEIKDGLNDYLQWVAAQCG